jgi:AhpD family alkylhydroperoxidase
MFEQYLPFYGTWHNGGKVAPIIKEVARLRIAQLNNCAICKGARFAAAQIEGLTEQKIAEIDNYESSNSFTPQEKIAIRFAEKLALNHHSIDDDFMKAMRDQFTDPQIVELGMMIAQYLGFGRVLAVLVPDDSTCSLDRC